MRRTRPFAGRARSWPIIAILATSLAGCATAGSDRPAAVVTCPPLVTYPLAFQRAAADELDALPTGSRVAVLVVDYSRMRDACRAIEARR